MLRTITNRTAPRISTSLVAAQQIRHNDPQTKTPPHAIEKDHELDVQSHSSKQGMRERSGAGGSEKGIKKNPKEGHPKAPEPVIGMQDERGHRNSN